MRFRLRTWLPVLLGAALLPCAARAQVSSTIAPGIEAPNGGTPFAEITVAGKHMLVPVHHADVGFNNRTGANVAAGLFAGPFARQKQTTQLAGEHARTQLPTGAVVFYVMPVRNAASEGDTSQGGMPIELVRVVAGKDDRVLQQVNSNAFGGGAKKKDAGLLVATDNSVLPSGWTRITPREPLPAGEYALVPVVPGARTFASVVWDFGVDAAAPAPTDATTLP